MVEEAVVEAIEAVVVVGGLLRWESRRSLRGRSMNSNTHQRKID